MACDCDELERQINGCGYAPLPQEGQPTYKPDEYSDGELAEESYWLADVGKVKSRLGWLWPYCPRYWVSQCSHRARIEGDVLLGIVRAWRQGVPLPELTAGGLRAVLDLDTLWTSLQAELDQKPRKGGSVLHG